MLVENPDQEEEARARGYLAAGEAPAPPVDFEEYPLMMAHPDHRDAIPDEIIPQRMPDNSIQTTVVPGSTEQFPHVAARDEEHEAELAAKGYQRMGRSDPAAVETAAASPYVPGRTKSDYPKWVDGVLIQDPAKPASGPAQYPKWIAAYQQEVGSAKEEAELLGIAPPEEPVVEVSKNPEIEQMRAELAELKAALSWRDCSWPPRCQRRLMVGQRHSKRVVSASGPKPDANTDHGGIRLPRLSSDPTSDPRGSFLHGC